MGIYDYPTRRLALLLLLVQGFCYPLESSPGVSLPISRSWFLTKFGSTSVARDKARTARDATPALDPRAIMWSPTNKLAIGLGLGFGVLVRMYKTQSPSV